MSSFLQHLFVLALFVRQALCISVTIPIAVPTAAPTLSPSLMSLSIELDRWNDWIGTTSRNQFFYNTLDNLGKLTGEPPRLRIGGDTEDRTIFDPSMKFSTATFAPPTSVTPYPEASPVIIGDGFFQATQFLPPNTHLTWGINLKRNWTTAYLETISMMKAFASPAFKKAGIILDYIEVGNEPDPKIFTLAEYVANWTMLANNISSSVGLNSSPGTTKFWSGGFSGSTHTTTGLSPQGIFAQGILNSTAGSLITAFSQHHYEGGFCAGMPGLLQNLMDKNLIRNNLTSLKQDIAVVQARGFEYFLGETNSDSCHGIPGVSNTAGAALWTWDHALYSAQLGISRLYFHEGIGFKYNLIQPITLNISTIDGTPLATPLPPHIQPQYYGAIIAAEAIGNSGGTRAIELNINNTRVSGYAFYVKNKLARAVLINSQAYLATTTTPRGTTLINFNFTGSGAPLSMSVKRLAINHADDTVGLTWGGQTYETSNAIVSGLLQVQMAKVSDGVVLHDTEVVLLTFI